MTRKRRILTTYLREYSQRFSLLSSFCLLLFSGVLHRPAFSAGLPSAEPAVREQRTQTASETWQMNYKESLFLHFPATFQSLNLHSFSPQLSTAVLTYQCDNQRYFLVSACCFCTAKHSSPASKPIVTELKYTNLQETNIKMQLTMNY